jgi:hypothetical protein
VCEPISARSNFTWFVYHRDTTHKFLTQPTLWRVMSTKMDNTSIEAYLLLKHNLPMLIESIGKAMNLFPTVGAYLTTVDGHVGSNICSTNWSLLRRVRKMSEYQCLSFIFPLAIWRSCAKPRRDCRTDVSKHHRWVLYPIIYKRELSSLVCEQSTTC